MMFKKSQLGWRLAKPSLAILSKLKKGWILILLSRGVYFLIFLAMIVLLWTLRIKGIDIFQLPTKIVLNGYLIVILALLIGNLISSYFSAALLYAVHQYDSGQIIGFGEALKKANQRSIKVLLWTLFQLTGGVLIMLLFNQLMKISRIHNLLSGLRWHFAAFLVFPLLVCENYAVFPSIAQSSKLIQENVGPHPKLNFSFSLLFFLAYLVSFIPSIIGYAIGDTVWISIGAAITFLLLLFFNVLVHAIIIVIQHTLHQWLYHHQLSHGFSEYDVVACVS